MIAGEDKISFADKVISTQRISPKEWDLGIAIRSGSSVVCNDVENDVMMAPWKRKSFGKGIFIGDGFAYRNGTKIIGAIIFSGDKTFDAERC
jgi:hypothetical protein